jgi:hypothetical protein
VNFVEPRWKLMSHTKAPAPPRDWITQKALARILGISQRAASVWARGGRLTRFEHGMPGCGRRRHSRALVEMELDRRWQVAIARQKNDGNDEREVRNGDERQHGVPARKAATEEDKDSTQPVPARAG